jgi:hypothetical protein
LCQLLQKVFFKIKGRRRKSFFIYLFIYLRERSGYSVVVSILIFRVNFPKMMTSAGSGMRIFAFGVSFLSLFYKMEILIKTYK